MNLIKAFFAILITKRVLSIIVSITIALVLFFTFTDIGFMSNVFDGVFSWMEKNMNSMINWVLAAIKMIMSKFQQNGL